VLSRGFKVEVRALGRPWVTSDVCGVDECRALECAQERVDEALESTDIQGDLVMVRRWARVRVLRGRTVVREWKHGQAPDDEADQAREVA
jgi:hypothetical protein